MKADELRKSFIEFFEGKGHKVVPSDSLVPKADPTVLFTGAGMNQFKDMFLGKGRLPFKRATTCQKCLRTGDIDKVGATAYHHTFFEMLGNFSFGDYFKREAIFWAWEYLTEILHIPQEKLRVSVYENDKEAYSIWEEIGIMKEWIYKYGEGENFWPAYAPSRGPNGVCGPCSEIYYDQGKEVGCGRQECEPSCECNRFVEVWNLVFTQFDRKDGGVLEPLPQRNIDTGMGLERLTAVMQGKLSNFDTELFMPIIEYACELGGIRYRAGSPGGRRLRRIADHIRAVTFCIADGALPSNTERGYVVRKLLRRASADGREVGIEEPFLYKCVAVVADIMSEPYPEVLERRENIARIIKVEEERFAETLTQGLALIDQYIETLKESGSTVLSGKDAFRLYDTYGFPIDLAESILEDYGISVDIEGFEREMEEQRKRARLATTLGGVFAERPLLELRSKLEPTVFTGYETTEDTGTVLGIISENEIVEELEAQREATVILQRTPFYAEAGGQVGDTGVIEGEDWRFVVKDTKLFEEMSLHEGKLIEGKLRAGNEARAKVNAKRRLDIARNHTATHILHFALRTVVGQHCEQSGSLVAPDRLRFDFTHFEPLTREQLAQVEELVNQKVIENASVSSYDTTYEEARSSGVIALFTEKYGERVRVVKVGDYSKELCGGTHLTATGYIGLFKIVSEESVSSGVRRIEAVTGHEAYQYIRKREEVLSEVAELLGAPSEKLTDRVKQLQLQLKELRKELESARRMKATLSVEGLLEGAEEVKGVKLIGHKFEGVGIEELRSASDLLRRKAGSAGVVLAASQGGKVNLLIALTEDLVRQGLKASELIKEPASIVGGGGGGRASLAQAGGRKPEALDSAISRALELLRERISG